ncbi:hypothetical protein [Streptomyces sp. 1331.2]|uniref:hypothetical protein n=1 Tax=Streptomyces sp. 1331.2 TaxID=1938835 RepID=UPI000BD62842|nr:hypothetical protein [Streptomyces sp. 1331.2]SOB84843.1 preprotein translocase subunit SecY [Streptomyces sp. 1331.2]
MPLLRTPGLGRRVAVTLGGIVLFRLGQSLPLPGVDPAALGPVADGVLPGDGLRGLADLATGGGMYRLALLPFGVLPFLFARVLVPALARLHPRLAALRAVRAGRFLLERRTALALGLLGGLVLALVAAAGHLLPGAAAEEVLHLRGPLAVVVLAAGAAAGTAVLLPLTRWMDRNGLGDAVAVLLFVQVLAVLPGQLWAVRERSGSGGCLAVAAAVLVSLAVTIALVIAGRKGERRVEVRYSPLGGRRPGAELRYVPLVLSHRGFVPAVVAVLLFAPLRLPRLPYLALLFLLAAAGACLAVWVGRSVLTDPEAKLRTHVYLPGVEPGVATVEYLAALRRRLAVAEALGTGLVAVLPALALAAAGGADSDGYGFGGYAFGGASVLLVAGAAIDAVGSVMQEVQRRRVMHYYAARSA